jgi:hypothetical protein
MQPGGYVKDAASDKEVEDMAARSSGLLISHSQPSEGA